MRSSRLGLSAGVLSLMVLSWAGHADAVAPAAPQNCQVADGTFSLANAPLTIPTGPAVVTSTIEVTGANPYLWDLDVRTAIAHTFPGDLDVTLTSPQGTVVTLTTDNGNGNDNVFNGTTWDDSADPDGVVPYVSNEGVATDTVYANLVTETPLTPEEGLAAFVGENPNGTWTLTISDDASGDGGSLDGWGLQISALAATPTSTLQNFTTSPALVLADPGATTSTLLVAGVTDRICGVQVRTGLQHTFSSDLDITLTSPTGTVVTLTTDNGGGFDNVFDGTVWSDDADPGSTLPYANSANTVTDNLYANLVPEATLTPEEPLGAFIGENANGVWTLTVSDDSGGDSGSLSAWGIRIDECGCTVLPNCGDGVLGGVEVCDDGNLLSGDGCDANCTPTGCGNGILTAGEVCDDGNAANGDGCDNNCSVTACGNGVVTIGEVCDDGNLANGDGCDMNCTLTSCGNSVVSAGEACDDGNAFDGDGCDTNCTLTACGNGILSAGEVCDDGNAIDCDGCRADCSDTEDGCGDSYVCGAESCDDGNLMSGDGCDANCTPTGCGNGIAFGKDCDDGNLVDGDGCDSNCTPTACGNGVMTQGEACDDGNDANGDGCDNNCTVTACGNAILSAPETCDDGNGADGDGCDSNCTVTGCGNGVLTEGEACDDGNLKNNDGCSGTCEIEDPGTGGAGGGTGGAGGGTGGAGGGTGGQGGGQGGASEGGQGVGGLSEGGQGSGGDPLGGQGTGGDPSSGGQGVGGGEDGAEVEGGCDCQASAGASSSSSGGLFALLGLIGLAAKRRRNRA